MSKHYPVEGVYLNGVPHVEHDCDDKFHVTSGAFTTEKAKPTKRKTRRRPTAVVPTETEGPADAGPLDSQEA